jgi:hypothetical protein
LIEHSYKADSDLSPAGWEYSERLKAAVMARRKAVREERRARGEAEAEENPLLVSARGKGLTPGMDLGAAQGIPHGVAVCSCGIQGGAKANHE